MRVLHLILIGQPPLFCSVTYLLSIDTVPILTFRTKHYTMGGMVKADIVPMTVVKKLPIPVITKALGD
jgi:hypothetical protein